MELEDDLGNNSKDMVNGHGSDAFKASQELNTISGFVLDFGKLVFTLVIFIIMDFIIYAWLPM
jgi:large-conductance mechanosensitive channel